MGVGRIWRKKSVRRPKKTGTERRRREKLHRKEVISLGTAPAKVRTMTHKDVLALRKDLIKAAAKTKAKSAAKPKAAAAPKAKAKA